MANVVGPYPVKVMAGLNEALYRKLKRLAAKRRVSLREALRQLIAEATQ